MSRDEQLKERWEQLVTILSDRFADGDILDLDAIIYLIGVQELGQFNKKFKKDEKVKEQIRSANTIGCFYIESPAMRNILQKLRCNDYNTLVAASKTQC